MKSVWNGKGKFLVSLVCCCCFAVLDAEEKTVPPAEFFSYNGFCDWWRIPLKFPYQIMICDTFDSGMLEKYDPKYPVENPNVSSTSIMKEWIVAAAGTKNFLAFRSEKKDFGVLDYQSGCIKRFDTENELREHLHKTYDYTEPLKFLDLKTFYRRVWNQPSSAPNPWHRFHPFRLLKRAAAGIKRCIF